MKRFVLLAVALLLAAQVQSCGASGDPPEGSGNYARGKRFDAARSSSAAPYDSLFCRSICVAAIWAASLQ